MASISAFVFSVSLCLCGWNLEGNRVMADRRLRRMQLLAAAVACLALAPGCQTMHEIKAKASGWRPFSSAYDDPKADEKLVEAQTLFDNAQYSKAQSLFKELADNTGNSATLAEQARWMQAESRRARGHYPEAIDTYHRLLMDFPTGAHRQEACGKVFEICDYWLDDFRDDLEKRSGEKGVLRWRPHWPA